MASGRLTAFYLGVTLAILTAASIRLRPILMTSLISTIVLIPVAFFPRTGSCAVDSRADCHGALAMWLRATGRIR